MTLTPAVSKRNFYSLLWHAGFLAMAQNFIDTDTIIPAMLVDAGGTSVHIGILTAILLGGSSFTQLIFAPFISNYSFKKKFLLLGINARMLALMVLGIFLLVSAKLSSNFEITLIFILISVFALGGAFANISYTDIMGKSVLATSRKQFFSVRQIITGTLVVGSVFGARYVITLNEYPYNYGYMLLSGFILLSIASLGFWNLKEVTPSKFTVKGPAHFYQLVKEQLKHNPRLGYLLGFINTQGIAVGFLPFVLFYAKSEIGLDNDSTGNFLLFKIIGFVTTGVLLALLKGKYKYKHLLLINLIFSTSIILTMIGFNVSPPFYIIFLIGGAVFGIYSISMNGVLLEVSDNTNRALYTGIAGAGNILPALFPLTGGWLIQLWGFETFFWMYAVVISSSLFFILKLRCKH